VSPVSDFATALVSMSNPFWNVPLPSAFPLSITHMPYTQFTSPSLIPCSGANCNLPGGGIFPDLHNFNTPYVTQYTLGIQWEAVNNLLLDVAYVGSRGRDLTHLVSLNSRNAPVSEQPYLNALSNFTSPVFGTYVEQTSGSSRYNSMQTSLTKRFSHGLQFLASYTYSHSSDDYSGGDVNDLVGVPGDTRLHYFASSDFDRRHRFIVSYLYELPKFYKGDNGAAKRIVNDWQLAGITTLQSGTPFSIVGSATVFSSTFGQLAAGRTVASGQKSGDAIDRLGGANGPAYFDTTAFGAVSGFGQSLRNVYRGPGQENFDFSVTKFIPITERQKLEFRTEFFNIFNHTNFANPVGVYGSTFGQVLRTSTGPRVIQFGFKYNF
jgi:hypothetical protein